MEEVNLHVREGPAATTSETRVIWQSCCLNCDRDVVMYLSKLLFSLTILTFAIYTVLSNDDPCRDLSFPTGLIGTILGSFVEQGSQRMSTMSNRR
jgi:hypothetical protein